MVEAAVVTILKNYSETCLNLRCERETGGGVFLTLKTRGGIPAKFHAAFKIPRNSALEGRKISLAGFTPDSLAGFALNSTSPLLYRWELREETSDEVPLIDLSDLSESTGLPIIERKRGFEVREKAEQQEQKEEEEKHKTEEQYTAPNSNWRAWFERNFVLNLAQVCVPKFHLYQRENDHRVYFADPDSPTQVAKLPIGCMSKGLITQKEHFRVAVLRFLNSNGIFTADKVSGGSLESRSLFCGGK